MRRVAMAIIMSSVALAVEAAAHPLYESGRSAWHVGDFPTAYVALLEFRREPYGRRPDVDFMLGTSACRMEAHRRWGHDVLDWMLYAYALTSDSRTLVARERELCRTVLVAQLVNTPLEAVREERAAGMTGYGKTFYWANQDQQPVFSYPIRRMRPMEQAELIDRLVAIGEEERALTTARELLPDATTLVHDHFLLVSTAGHTEAELASIGQTLSRFLRFLANTYDIDPPQHYITVYLVHESYEVSALATELHGLDVSGATVGYAFVDDASVVGAVPGTAAGTVLHELFHLLVRADFGDIPQWLDEGIASLYEVSGRTGDHYVGLPNWRGAVLEELWSERPSVEELIRTEWFLFDDPEQAQLVDTAYVEEFQDASEGRRQAAMMAMARYFALYLERQNGLVPVFRAIRDRGFLELEGGARDHAVRLVEEAVGRSVAELDREFAVWFETRAFEQRPPLSAGRDLFVANADVNVRTGPGTDFERRTLLRKGSTVAVFASHGDWYEVRFDDGTVGYVFGRYLDRAAREG